MGYWKRKEGVGMMEKLSIKQKQTLEAIEWFIDRKGFSPTFQELAYILDCNICTVFKKIIILEQKGYISTERHKKRTIRILKGLSECEV